MDNTKSYSINPDIWIAIITIGVLLSCGISLILSIDLFATAGSNFWYQVLFGGIAVALELMKFCLISISKDKIDKKDILPGIGAAALFLGLASISVMGSVGAIQRDNQELASKFETASNEKAAIQTLLSTTLEEIRLNNDAIAYYQAEEKIKAYAAPLKASNRLLREDVGRLTTELRALSKANESTSPETTLQALTRSLARAADTDLQDAQWYTILFLAVFLELAAGFFVYAYSGLPRPISTTANSTETSQKNSTTRVGADSQSNNDEPDNNVLKLNTDLNNDSRYQKIRSYVLTQNRISRNETMRKYRVGSDKMTEYLDNMIQEGILAQNEANRYIVVQPEVA